MSNYTADYLRDLEQQMAELAGNIQAATDPEAIEIMRDAYQAAKSRHEKAANQ